MYRTILFLTMISFSLFADNDSEKKCKAIQEKNKDKCGKEQVTKCVWAKDKCKTNKVFLEDGEIITEANDKCNSVSEEKLCAEEKVSLCVWSDEISKCVLNEDEKGKSLNLPHDSGKSNRPKQPPNDALPKKDWKK